MLPRASLTYCAVVGIEILHLCMHDHFLILVQMDPLFSSSAPGIAGTDRHESQVFVGQACHLRNSPRVSSDLSRNSTVEHRRYGLDDRNEV